MGGWLGVYSRVPPLLPLELSSEGKEGANETLRDVRGIKTFSSSSCLSKKEAAIDPQIPRASFPAFPRSPEAY